MAYQGESGQHFINFNALSFTTVEVIVTSSSFPNPCGHSILRIDDYYFHILVNKEYPRFMNQVQFTQYIEENDKTIIFNTRRFIQNKKEAMENLRFLLKKRWDYNFLTYNCLTFIEDIITTGADNIDMVFNCPTLLRSKVIRESLSWHARKITK